MYQGAVCLVAEHPPLVIGQVYSVLDRRAQRPTPFSALYREVRVAIPGGDEVDGWWPVDYFEFGEDADLLALAELVMCS